MNDTASDSTGNSSSDFLLGCAALAVCGRDGDGPIAGDTPEERRRWRFSMGVWILVYLVCYVAFDKICRWIFGL